jgi:hypothetical protein
MERAANDEALEHQRTANLARLATPDGMSRPQPHRSLEALERKAAASGISLDGLLDSARKSSDGEGA